MIERIIQTKKIDIIAYGKFLFKTHTLAKKLIINKNMSTETTTNVATTVQETPVDVVPTVPTATVPEVAAAVEATPTVATLTVATPTVATPTVATDTVAVAVAEQPVEFLPLQANVEESAGDSKILPVKKNAWAGKAPWAKDTPSVTEEASATSTTLATPAAPVQTRKNPKKVQRANPNHNYLKNSPAKGSKLVHTKTFATSTPVKAHPKPATTPATSGNSSTAATASASATMKTDDGFTHIPTKKELSDAAAAKKKEKRIQAWKEKKAREAAEAATKAAASANSSATPSDASATSADASVDASANASDAQKPVEGSNKNFKKNNGKPPGLAKPQTKPLTDEERAAKKEEWAARKARREEYEKRRAADHENFQAAMKEAEMACLQELLVSYEFIEDRITEARYTVNDRTGAPNRNISMRVNHVRDQSYKGKTFTSTAAGRKAAQDSRLYSPWKIASPTDDNSASTTPAATSTSTGAPTENSGEDTETRGDYCDTIMVGKYKFSRSKFYSNRFFNNALSDLYIKELNLNAFLRPYRFRGQEGWNLYIGW